MGFTFIPPDYEDFVTIDPLDFVTVTPYITIRKREGTMNIRNVTQGSLIRTRTSRNEPDVYEFQVMDNYWNRRTRLCRMFPGGGAPCMVPTIDFAEVWSVEKCDWEPVELTKAQQKQLQMQRHLEYVTSPESETYWCS